jgi:hypothetical protein
VEVGARVVGLADQAAGAAEAGQGDAAERGAAEVVDRQLVVGVAQVAEDQAVADDLRALEGGVGLGDDLAPVGAGRAGGRP